MGDELVWQRRSKGEDNWRARSAADDGTYVAYAISAYGTIQIQSVLVRDESDSLTGEPIYTSIVGAGSLSEAKGAAQDHHNAACRARRWRDYMLTNEPPKGDQ